MGVCASFLAFCYNILQPTPLLAPAGWCVFFVCGQLVQIARILRDRVEIEMTGDFADLYESAFHPHGFRPRQFVNFMDVGKVEHVSAGQLIVSNGQEANEVVLMWTGVADVLDGSGDAVGQVIQNRFIGNMVSKQGAHPWRYNIKAKAPCKVVRWRKAGLKQLLESDKELYESVASLIANDLSRKLSDASTAHAVKKYAAMLLMATADGRLAAEEKKQLREYRLAHAISPEVHVTCLEQVGWSSTEYDDGVKHTRLNAKFAGRLAHFLHFDHRAPCG